MNITIRPGAATDDALEIENIVSAIESDMETLDGAIKSTIPDGISTDWGDELKERWTNYYNEQIPAAMEDMKLSATNLKIAIADALEYNK